MNAELFAMGVVAGLGVPHRAPHSRHGQPRRARGGEHRRPHGRLTHTRKEAANIAASVYAPLRMRWNISSSSSTIISTAISLLFSSQRLTQPMTPLDIKRL